MGLIRRTSHTLLACALIGAAITPMPAWAVSPSSARVLAAAADDSDPAVIEVKKELDAAEASAAEASRRALDASAEAERTRLLAQSTAERAAALAAQSSAADAAMASAHARAGASASRLYRTTGNGPLVAQLLTSADPDSLLDRLGILDRVTTLTTRDAGEARSAADVATSLRTQAEAAQAEAARLAAQSATEAAAAQTQADAEAQTVTATQAQLDALYARLAELRRTTAEQERQARLREKAEKDAQEPGGNGGGSTGGGSGSGGNTGGGGSTGGGGNNNGGGGGGGNGGGGSGSGGNTGGGSGSGGNTGGGSGSGGNTGGGSGGGGNNGGGSGGGTTPPPTAPAGPIMSPGQARDYARGAINGYGWGDDQFSCLVSLWNRESGWRADALNPWSGAYGIPQALPGEKMASAGPDWRTNAATQIAWGLSYISARYGTPCGAWGHSEQTGWY
ncbi:lytic transglycosylase domain-containing protein [Microbacterium testaceum]|uniref:aggregation-promoting factor C-terminal-like domain-containing protein n=1 Tax=Microbacterium testaceum TaxID=2033 RepID=UPI0007341B9F